MRQINTHDYGGGGDGLQSKARNVIAGISETLRAAGS